MAAAREQAHERAARRGAGAEVERRDVAFEVVDGHERQPPAHAIAFAADTPTSSAPTSPGPCVTATRSTSASDVPASSSASRTTGVTSSRCRLDAISGTTPP